MLVVFYGFVLTGICRFVPADPLRGSTLFRSGFDHPDGHCVDVYGHQISGVFIYFPLQVSGRIEADAGIVVGIAIKEFLSVVTVRIDTDFKTSCGVQFYLA